MVKMPSGGETCTTGAGGMIAQSVAEIVSRHVWLAVEGIEARSKVLGARPGGEVVAALGDHIPSTYVAA